MSNISSEEIPRNTKEIKIDLLKNPVFIYVGHLQYKHRHHFPVHKHDYYTEILYIVNGESDFLIDDNDYYAKSGDIVLFNSGVVHEEFHALKNNIDAYYCAISNIQFKNFKELWLMPTNGDPVLHTDNYQEQIKNIFQDLYKEGCSRQPGSNNICNSLVLILSILILRIINEENRVLTNIANTNSTYVLVETIKNYVNANVSSSLVIEKIADHFHLSPSYVSHIFKSIAGMPLMKYHNNKRMDEAKRLLLSTNLPVCEIAYTIGFQNTNHFYLPFKKYTGVTPQEYRDRIKKSVIHFSN